MERVILIGLDGGTWDLLKPWIDKGELKNLKQLLDNGVYANLISTIPFITAPAWISFSTGRNPGKHGIFDFVFLKKNKLILHKSNDIKSSQIHYILSQNGINNIIMGLPLSFPPTNTFKGIMISDFLFPKKSIYPREKNKYLKNYKVMPNLMNNLYKKEILLDDLIKTSTAQIKTLKALSKIDNSDLF